MVFQAHTHVLTHRTNNCDLIWKAVFASVIKLRRDYLEIKVDLMISVRIRERKGKFNREKHKEAMRRKADGLQSCSHNPRPLEARQKKLSPETPGGGEQYASFQGIRLIICCSRCRTLRQWGCRCLLSTAVALTLPPPSRPADSVTEDLLWSEGSQVQTDEQNLA